MTTINQYISDLRALIKESGRSEDIYTDSFLYSLLNGARTAILEQEANKLSFTSEWDWLSFPVKLIKTKSHLVGCVEVGCDVLRSEYKLPRVLASNIKDLFRVTTFDYSKITIGTEQDYQNSKYDDIKSKEPFVSIINGYLVVWNRPTWKWVLVSAIWEDVLDWMTIPHCDEDGEYTTSPCFDMLNSDFKISEKLKLATYQMVLDKLGMTLNKIKDMTNDANSQIHA